MPLEGEKSCPSLQLSHKVRVFISQLVSIETEDRRMQDNRYWNHFIVTRCQFLHHAGPPNEIS